MIQQQLYQDLSESSDFNQQMMLCPVRVVYDTQMYMQQGEQVQQNQYIINPQNPPPWIQNQVQNQVIYVQNVPNNYMPTYQQHIDPNQFQTYGYNVPQMLVQAPQDPRIQVIPANLVPNINVNQRTITQNIGAVANTLMISEVQNQNIQVDKQLVTNEIVHSEINKSQDISNQTVNHQMPIYHTETKLQIQQQLPVISNIQQRLTHIDQNNIQIRHVHPQVVASNVQQNYQAIIPQKLPGNVQQNYQNVVQQKLPNNIQPNFQTIVTQKVPPMKNNYQVVSGNGQPIYRAIHPRPNQFNNQPVQQVPSQNIVYMNSIKRNNVSNTVNTQNIIPNFVKIDSSRKRKSESPEEIPNKIIIPNTNNMIIKEEPTSKQVVEIISNPTTVSKSENKIMVNSLQITPLDRDIMQYPKIKEELAKPVKPIALLEPKQMIRNKMINNVEAIQNLSNISVQDKLIRNTVYTQARGRLITEQETAKVAIQPIIATQTQTVNIDKKVDTSLAKSENIDSKLNEDKTEIKESNIEEKKEIKDTTETKTENVDNVRVKEEKSFLLTHVLDGYVIQESNMAFPIRKPLKEKTLRMTTDIMEPKREPEEPKIEVEEKTKEESERLLDISQLHLKEDMPTEISESESEKDTPFTNIDPNNVKSWTVEELSKHLTKFGWEETIAHLQDHEIDGESLFLVSKSQLTRIGISEEHASIICDFVKKS